MSVATSELRLNLGCGDYGLSGFINIDSAGGGASNLVLDVPPLPWEDECIAEIYAGHFLEHLDHDRGAELLREAYRVLEPGGTIGIVVPDFREMARRYVNGDDAPFEWSNGTNDLRDLDQLCYYALFSTVQPSRHQWMYDLDTLQRALERAGFEVLEEIDRLHDFRLSSWRWYQCGLDARKPERR